MIIVWSGITVLTRFQGLIHSSVFPSELKDWSGFILQIFTVFLQKGQFSVAENLFQLPVYLIKHVQSRETG